ncbi:MAG: dihydroorotase [Actinomycetaceae bacterium]|nr:dihydroorotase [Actinomycetaceae bacterium]
MFVLDKPRSTHGGGLTPISPTIFQENPLLEFLNSERFFLFPGFCDVHVHFREPGFSYKETISTGCAAAARGGFTAVATMPNLDPVPDSAQNLALAQKLIDEDATIDVYPYGSISIGEKGKELADLRQMAPGAVAFSDDGMGVQCADMMRKAMLIAKDLDKVIAAHCEDAKLKGDGYINAGAYAKAHGHVGIPTESEWKELARDIVLAKETGAALHACHVSCRESVDLVRQAKAAGVDVTCETAPHYLVFSDDMLQEDGRFKMNPPLRSAADRTALIEALVDGTLDMIATDHAPHSAAEKARGLADSAFGIVGLETSFPAIYTHFVRPGIISLERALELFVTAPRKRFNMPLGNDFSVWDLDYVAPVDPDEFATKGRATPFAGQELYGRCLLTVHAGKVVHMDTAAIEELRAQESCR